MEINTYSLYKQYTTKLFVYKNSIWISSIGKPKLKEIDERGNDDAKIKRHKEFNCKHIDSILTNEISQQVKIKHFKKNKLKTSRLQLDDVEQKNMFLKDVEETNLFEKSIEKENPTKGNIPNFIYSPLIFALAYYIFSIENLEDSALNTSKPNRNRWVLDLLNLIIETIGQINTALLIALIGVFIVYKIVMRYKNPKNNIILVNPNI